MIVHIALFRWKKNVSEESIQKALQSVRVLKNKIDGLVDIRCGRNFSQWSGGFTHAVVVYAKDQASLDAYRHHPGHMVVAEIIDSMEENAMGIDFEDKD